MHHGLPSAGDRESLTLDFKRAASPDPDFEKAKDVAAMANALGGRIVVGAVEENSTLVRLAPMPKHHAEAVARAYTLSVRDRCRPSPVSGVDVRDCEGGSLVEVWVEAFPGQPIGVSANCDDGTFKGVAWHFPLRTVEDTIAITPENLAMYFEPKIRRHIIALSRIVANEEVRVQVRPSAVDTSNFYKRHFREVSLERNTVGFLDGDPIPLDNVDAVYRLAPNAAQAAGLCVIRVLSLS